MNREIVLIAHDIRSCHNVGSLLRTCEGFGVNKVYLTGYTPYPIHPQDPRLPHESSRVSKQIHKTALGAESMVDWVHEPNVQQIIQSLKSQSFVLCALEQTRDAIELSEYTVPNKIAVIIGREVEGVSEDLLSTCDVHLEIPMQGDKESFNVVQAAAVCLYHCRNC